MRFEVKPHTSRGPDVFVVEVFDDKGKFVASITPGNTDKSIRVISKHMTSTEIVGEWVAEVRIETGR